MNQESSNLYRARVLIINTRPDEIASGSEAELYDDGMTCAFETEVVLRQCT